MAVPNALQVFGLPSKKAGSVGQKGQEGHVSAIVGRPQRIAHLIAHSTHIRCVDGCRRAVGARAIPQSIQRPQLVDGAKELMEALKGALLEVADKDLKSSV